VAGDLWYQKHKRGGDLCYQIEEKERGEDALYQKG
jgi:hypothetical protein